MACGEVGVAANGSIHGLKIRKMEVFAFILMFLLAVESCSGAPSPVGEFKGFPQLSSIVGSHHELGHKIVSFFVVFFCNFFEGECGNHSVCAWLSLCHLGL